MKSKNTKKIFDNYIISVLLAFLVVAVFNFATSTVNLITGKTSSTPVYAKAVDGIALTSATTEPKNTTSVERKAKTIANGYSSHSTTVSRTTTPVVKASATSYNNYVIVGGRTIKLEHKNPKGSTLIVPDNHAAYFGRFIYGHNISSVFAHLNTASVGEPITVSINGNTKTYRIVKKERKAIGEISMSSLIYTRSYAHTMMTCVGNGATHRDIIYLN